MAKMERNLRLEIRLPNSDFVNVDVLAVASTKIADILTPLRMEANPPCISGCSEKHMRFVYNGKALKSDSCILDHGLKDGDRIDIVIRMNGTGLLHEDVEYSSFVVSSAPRDGEYNVGTDSEIEITFGHSPYGLCVYTPALIDYENLLTSFPHGGDMIQSLDSNMQDATRRGYRPPWTEFKFNNKILLLELAGTDELMVRERIESCRYTWAGINNGYHEGDHKSWQRYTRSMPVDCIINENRDLDGSAILKLKPFNSLKHDTFYAVLLSNCTPTVPSFGVDASLYGFMSPGTCEDSLLLFRTISVEEEEQRAILLAARARAKSRKLSRKMSRKSLSPTKSSKSPITPTISESS